MIYADNAATTRLSEKAAAVMADCIRNDYGNPSSLYTFGQLAKEKLEDAREQIQREKDEAMLSVRREMASLSCDIAEKVLKEKLFK